MINSEDFEGSSFDSFSFVNNLTENLSSKDPADLYDFLVRVVSDVNTLEEKTTKRVEKLEQLASRELADQIQCINGLHKYNQSSQSRFLELNDRIGHVAKSICHVADKLESNNQPRTKLAEANALTAQFNKYVTGNVDRDFFTDPALIKESTSLVLNLKHFSHEFRGVPSMREVCDDIWDTYRFVEQKLVLQFYKAQDASDKVAMKEAAGLLLNFHDGYSDCVNKFIEHTLKSQFGQDDGSFPELFTLCQSVDTFVKDVFPNPDVVISRFYSYIYADKIANHITSRLANKGNVELYLTNLNDVYISTTSLSAKLMANDLSTDDTFFAKIHRQLFQKYLSTYITDEVSYLLGKCASVLSDYYKSIDHQRRPAAKSWNIINLGNSPGNQGDSTHCEKLLSKKQVSDPILGAFGVAFRRCETLSPSSTLTNDAVRLKDVLLECLVVNHINYGVEESLLVAPSEESKYSPSLHIFDVLKEANEIFLSLEKLYFGQFLPLVGSADLTQTLTVERNGLIVDIEHKLDAGLDKTLTAVCWWVKNILQSNQKRSDFKPELKELTRNVEHSTAAKHMIGYVSSVINHIKSKVDGANRARILSSFGTRLHSIIYEHLLQYQYNSEGGMQSILDTLEYKQCAKQFDVPVVLSAFEMLSALCNLLAIDVGNISTWVTNDNFACLDKSVIHGILQLRTDYKSGKISKHFAQS